VLLVECLNKNKMKTKLILLSVALISLLSCKEDKKPSVKTVEKPSKNYTAIGKEYAIATKKILGKNLKQAIAKDGTIGALAFCNEKANPLTHQMEVKYNATIKRVSDKNRNPNNKANATELKHIETFKTQLKNGEKIKPIIEKSNGEVHFYAPIKTGGLCLQCHGSPTTEVQSKIKELYPEDLATGYDVNQVRGIWSITFKE